MFEVLEVTLQLLRHFRWEYQRKGNPVDMDDNHPRIYFLTESWLWSFVWRRKWSTGDKRFAEADKWSDLTADWQKMHHFNNLFYPWYWLRITSEPWNVWNERSLSKVRCAHTTVYKFPVTISIYSAFYSNSKLTSIIEYKLL